MTISILNLASLIAAVYAFGNLLVILSIETYTKGDKMANGEEDVGSRWQKIQKRKKYVLITDFVVFGLLIVLIIVGIIIS